MGDGDRGIQIDAQFLTQIRAGARGPRRLPGCRPRGAHRRKVLGVDSVQHPPRRRHRGDRTEHALAITQDPDPGDRVRAIGYRDGQIGQHLARGVDPCPAVGVRQSVVERSDQARVLGELPQHPQPGVRDHARPVRTDPQPPK